MSATTERLAATALRMLSEKGVDCVLTTSVSGVMSASGERVVTPVVRTGKGVELPSPGEVLRDGERVRRGTILLSAVEPAPQTGDVALINGNERLVKLAENWAPDGLLIYSKLEVEL